MNGSILIVEDENELSAIVADYVSAAGYAVRVLADGREALVDVSRELPDLIVLDIMLPGLDGLALCKAVRAFSDVPIILVTARVQEIDRLLGLETGADDYVCKPFSPRELVARISRPGQVATRIEAAMTLISDTRALVIDLRRMHGGDPETIMLMASYLFDQPTHLNDIYWREGDRIESRWTMAQVSGRRYGQSRPVVILTSSDTFSAGEDFAYALKNAGRATLIGEPTGGGAHPGSPRRLNAHFMMNVPSGRAINPVTKSDWEGVGVVPDLAVSARNALDVGQVKLLEKLLSTEQDPNWRRRMDSCIKDVG